jgi:cell division septum initiation protein DivIVA
VTGVTQGHEALIESLPDGPSKIRKQRALRLASMKSTETALRTAVKELQHMLGKATVDVSEMQAGEERTRCEEKVDAAKAITDEMHDEAEHHQQFYDELKSEGNNQPSEIKQEAHYMEEMRDAERQAFREWEQVEQATKKLKEATDTETM